MIDTKYNEMRDAIDMLDNIILSDKSTELEVDLAMALKVSLKYWWNHKGDNKND